MNSIWAEGHLKFVTQINVEQNPRPGPARPDPSEHGPTERADSPPHEGTTDIKPAHVWLMAFSVGAVVANIYYIQPLLSIIAANFRISVSQVGAVAMLTQFGGAVGMLIFVPLGDTKERRRLIVSLLVAECICLALLASAQNLPWLALASFGVGVTTATVHVIVPFATHLASPARRGATVGAVLAGLLFGILLARSFSGLLGAWLGWRAIYWVGSALMLLLAILVRSCLPASQPELQLSWFSLVRSAFGLIRSQPVLRESAALGAIFFCSFSAFWTTLVFFLETSPYHYGSAVAGLFGLVGAVGAVCAPVIGRLADRYGARRNVLVALLVTLFSFVVLYFFGKHMTGLIAGVILLDIGVQSGHVSNQTRIYGLLPEARSRMNMVYMVCYFTAGAAGSYMGSLLWQHFRWAGVCGLGSFLLVTGCVIHASTGRKQVVVLAGAGT
ncbi:MAG TPA: MFS transporter [Candidatus Eremiobacteraceae bacterium]|nr:MFS transporter [Candidatus Eremiobacteraceae bacterium]